MKFLGLLWVLAAFERVAPVSAGACEGIHDGDSRHECRAMTSGRSVHCESIRNSDRRHYCRGVVTGRTTWCSSIRDGDLRSRCRAMAGRR